MIQLRSVILLADNSGAKKLHVIGVRRGNKGVGTVGDVVAAVVKGAIPHSAVKDGEIVKAVIVRTRKEIGRVDGSYIRFDENAAVVIDPKTKDPRGTRIFGPIPRELKELGYDKICSLAPEVL